MKTNQTKKLISNLKKEIKNLKEVRLFEMPNNIKSGAYFLNRDVEKIKQAQLQFAEKLIEAIKKDIKKISRVDIDLGGAGIYVKVRELNKILDEEIEK